jgi:hypothetical protein
MYPNVRGQQVDNEAVRRLVGLIDLLDEDQYEEEIDRQRARVDLARRDIESAQGRLREIAQQQPPLAADNIWLRAVYEAERNNEQAVQSNWEVRQAQDNVKVAQRLVADWEADKDAKWWHSFELVPEQVKEAVNREEHRRKELARETEKKLETALHAAEDAAQEARQAQERAHQLVEQALREVEEAAQEAYRHAELEAQEPYRQAEQSAQEAERILGRTRDVLKAPMEELSSIIKTASVSYERIVPFSLPGHLALTVD